MPCKPHTAKLNPLGVAGTFARVESHQRALLEFYDREKRPLPWRATSDPWAIWVSEVMLQQTRVDTVVPYYHRFLTRFPTPAVLAESDESEVLALWAGLGYYRRARLLHRGAKAVVAAHKGEVPRTLDGLRALPGVGEYTAGAIGSIAFGLRVPLVDGNVERVLTRVLALGGDPRSAETRKVLWSTAAQLADHQRAGDVNQALMELGATLCAPTSPRCLLCPLRSHCAAFRAGEPERYPEKTAKDAPREERWCALVARAGDSVWLVSPSDGRFGGMLLPPMTADTGLAGKELLAALDAVGSVRNPLETGSIEHVLTHARMKIRVFSATVVDDPPRGSLIPEETLGARAVPKITSRILECAGPAPTLRRAAPRRRAAR